MHSPYFDFYILSQGGGVVPVLSPVYRFLYSVLYVNEMMKIYRRFHLLDKLTKVGVDR